ncbi:MAG: P-protein [Candidatus Hydrogenedentes bacterium ADurb.Bin179]|nr:MAG: P-protein [Candidatus Hydrogenedentes bacterium ADurb.Bin179]
MDLDELRAKIDALDARIIEALNERAKAAQAIGELKRCTNAPIYVPEREKTVFSKLAQCNVGPLDDKAIQSIYREIISAIRALEKPTSVAFLGPKDTFSHMAALRVFGVAAEYLPLPSFLDVFTEVERKRIDYGIVPVESSMGGSVSDTLDSFISSNLKIVNEVLLHITQNLLSNCPMKEIRRVYSKDNAILQCRNWLRANLPGVELIETSSTAEAARRASGEAHAAAIASRLAAQTYSLDIQCERIEDVPHNYTRFVVIGHQVVKRTGDDKTAILVWVKDKPGALYNMLLPFARHNINLTRIESRPSQQKAWEYVFFIDFLGHVEDAVVQETLEEAGDHARNLKVLGSFPRAELQE